MSQLKRVVVNLPEALLAEVDCVAHAGSTSRSGFIRSVVMLYLVEQKGRVREEELRAGYEAMGATNLALAEEALACDERCLEGCEVRLSEGTRA